MMQSWDIQRQDAKSQELVLKIMDRITQVEEEWAVKKSGPAAGVAHSRRRWGWVTVLEMTQELLENLGDTTTNGITGQERLPPLQGEMTGFGIWPHGSRNS